MNARRVGKFSESVRKHYLGLHSFRSMRRMEASGRRSAGLDRSAVWLLLAGLQGINCRRRKGRREMGGRGRDAAHMARARAKRASFTDARDGRIKSQIRFAFFLSRGKPLTTSQLLKSCYCTVPIFGEKFQSWHRTNVCRAADQVAVRLGRASSRGRPVLWGPRPELMQQWRWRGLKRGSGDA
jgi:hypothetical protein